MLLVLAATMWCSLSASAQHLMKKPKVQASLEETLRMVEKMNRHKNAYTTKLDSVTMYEGDNMRVLFDYDTRFNCTRIFLYYLYDEWETEVGFDFAYDEQDRMITFIDYDEERKDECIYNAQGLVEEIYRSRYQDDGTWELFEKQVLTYDTDSHLVLSLVYDMENGNWVELAKQTWDYEGGLLQTYTFYYHNEGEWTPAHKTEYVYNTEGLCIEETESLWTSQEFWRPDSRIVYQYDAQQHCIEKAEYIAWYDEGWAGQKKYSYEYDATGNLITEIYYTYQSDTQEWEHRTKAEYQYDADHNCTDYYMYYMYFSSEDWDLEETYHLTYGSETVEEVSGLALFWELFELEIPIHTRVNQYTLDEDGDLYALDFHYSSTVGVEEQSDSDLKLWPNPASQIVHIDGIDVNEVQIYNTLGQLVKTVRKSNEVSFEDLQQSVYLLRITDAEGLNHAARIIVK